MSTPAQLAWRLANRERLLAEKRKWHAEHREEQLARMRQRYAEKTEEYLQRAKTNHCANRDAELERMKTRYWTNREKEKQARREHYASNPGAYKATAAKRKAAKRQAVPVWAETEQIAALYGLASFLRSIGVDVHVDHIVPLRSPLVCGLHVLANLRLLLAADNRAKSNKLVDA